MLKMINNKRDVDLKIHAHCKKSIEIDRSLYPRTFISLINLFEFYAYLCKKQAQSHRLQNILSQAV